MGCHRSSWLILVPHHPTRSVISSLQDAYAGILGPTALDRQVAKFWINASFGNTRLLTKWSKDLVEDLQEKLTKKGLSGFDEKRYPMKTIKKKVLERHPLLARWGGEIRGRVHVWRDLMFTESEAIIGAMLTLMEVALFRHAGLVTDVCCSG